MMLADSKIAVFMHAVLAQMQVDLSVQRGRVTACSVRESR